MKFNITKGSIKFYVYLLSFYFFEEGSVKKKKKKKIYKLYVFKIFPFKFISKINVSKIL